MKPIAIQNTLKTALTLKLMKHLKKMTEMLLFCLILLLHLNYCKKNAILVKQWKFLKNKTLYSVFVFWLHDQQNRMYFVDNFFCAKIIPILIKMNWSFGMASHVIITVTLYFWPTFRIYVRIFILQKWKNWVKDDSFF